jgi:hypothetical protein
MDVPIYVGKTKNKLKTRESQHKRRLKKDITIFELDYVYENEWEFWEGFYIELLKSWGFNLINQNKAGGGPSYHTEESLLKMKNKSHPGTSVKLKGRPRPDVSERLSGMSFSKEHCDNISKGKYGAIYSQERNDKIKESNDKHYKKDSLRNNKISKKLKGRANYWISTTLNKPVVMLDKNYNMIEHFDSAVEAAKFLNKTSSSISECCNKKRKSAYGYIWLFTKDYLNLKQINK